MPWYYAGPDAQPVGPVSLEELTARRASGVLNADTYVIEHTGQPNGVGAWRHYREVFPAGSGLPPLPTIPHALTPPPLSAPHPLFPSAAHPPVVPPPAPHAASPQVAGPHGYYPVGRTNSWCVWGFALGLAGFVFAFLCGSGALFAAPGLAISILGLIQVLQHRGQTGKGMAVAGIVLSAVALIIALVAFGWVAQLAIKQHEQTATEQTSSNSE